MMTSSSTKGSEAQAARRVAVVCWNERDEIADAIAGAARTLGHSPTLFHWRQPIPADSDIVFSFAPYGSFMAVAKRLEAVPEHRRPVMIHWNTEGIPDLSLPWSVVYPLSCARSWVERVTVSNPGLWQAIDKSPLAAWQTRMLRYRYVGDYYYAYKRCVLNVFADSSQVYADIHRKHGLPTLYFPWGSVPEWYANLDLPRDIDVIWIGKRGSKRRSDLIDRVRADLAKAGVEVYMADNDEHPFVFGEQRTRMLNRAKVTLNITRTWYDDNFSRFSMAAPNRSLVVSEPMLPHCPEYVAGVHYVSAPVEELAGRIVHYLTHDAEREQIVQAAYELTVQELTMVNSVHRALAQAEPILAARRSQAANRGHGRRSPSREGTLA